MLFSSLGKKALSLCAASRDNIVRQQFSTIFISQAVLVLAKYLCLHSKYLSPWSPLKLHVKTEMLRQQAENTLQFNWFIWLKNVSVFREMEVDFSSLLYLVFCCMKTVVLCVPLIITIGFFLQQLSPKIGLLQLLIERQAVLFCFFHIWDCQGQSDIAVVTFVKAKAVSQHC